MPEKSWVVCSSRVVTWPGSQRPVCYVELWGLHRLPGCSWESPSQCESWNMASQSNHGEDTPGAQGTTDASLLPSGTSPWFSVQTAQAAVSTERHASCSVEMAPPCGRLCCLLLYSAAPVSQAPGRMCGHLQGSKSSLALRAVPQDCCPHNSPPWPGPHSGVFCPCGPVPQSVRWL